MNALRRLIQKIDFGTSKRVEAHVLPQVSWPTIRPLASLLPYRRFEEETSLFINQNSFGFLLETSPLLGADENTCQILSGMITQGLPAGTVLQFFQWSSPRIAPWLSAWQNLRSAKGELYAKLAQNRTDFLSQGAHQSLIPGSLYFLRHYRTFIAVSFAGVPSDLQRKSVIALQKSMVNTLDSVKCSAELCAPNAFLSLLDEWLNPQKTLQPHDAEWNELDPLHLQAASPESALSIHANELRLGSDTAVRALSVRQLPTHWAQWQMGQLIGDAFNGQLQIPCPTLTTLALHLILRNFKTHDRLMCSINNKPISAF